MDNKFNPKKAKAPQEESCKEINEFEKFDSDTPESTMNQKDEDDR